MRFRITVWQRTGGHCATCDIGLAGFVHKRNRIKRRKWVCWAATPCAVLPFVFLMMRAWHKPPSFKISDSHYPGSSSKIKKISSSGISRWKRYTYTISNAGGHARRTLPIGFGYRYLRLHFVFIEVKYCRSRRYLGYVYQIHSSVLATPSIAERWEVD